MVGIVQISRITAYNYSKKQETPLAAEAESIKEAVVEGAK